MFAQIWKDPGNPKWDDDVSFPVGTVAIKVSGDQSLFKGSKVYQPLLLCTDGRS